MLYWMFTSTVCLERQAKSEVRTVFLMMLLESISGQLLGKGNDTQGKFIYLTKHYGPLNSANSGRCRECLRRVKLPVLQAVKDL